MVREVRLLGDPVLRRKAKPVAELDSGVRALINDLFDTMYKEEGVGLAAPQVGISERVIVIDPHDPELQPLALVNPRIVQHGEELDRGEEGCLSLPGLKDIVERPATVVVEGLGRDGQPLHIEASGLLARILQHEIDHLDGILFVDRVSPLKRKLLLKKWQKVKPTTPA
ncbi:MAG: peptide deformylase [Longimicrobiales bacterium]